MDNSEDMDIESLVNNPFQFYGYDKPDMSGKANTRKAMRKRKSVRPDSQKQETSERDGTSAETGFDRMNRNHPLSMRVLNLEKNHLIRDKKIDTLKKIIECQNKRIELLEKELDIIRNRKEGK